MTRKIATVVRGMAASDGDGVKLTRVIGTPYLDMLDPFLLLDEFGSDEPNDYLGGFPDHPHRGFETVTYILNGKMRHKDNAGHEGVIGEGDVQWMSAGRGILHSEMPEQTNGLLRGFQLWINLPAKSKMSKPRYQEYLNDQLPIETNDQGSTIKVIAGTTNSGTSGPIEAEFTKPIYFDVTLKPGDRLSQHVPASFNTILYGIEGSFKVNNDGRNITPEEMAILTLGHLTADSKEANNLEVEAGANGARFLLLAAEPLNEPVVRGGPFVMNSRAEILQAFQDFHAGKF